MLGVNPNLLLYFRDKLPYALAVAVTTATYTAVAFYLS